MSGSSAPVVNRLRIIPRTDDFLDRNVGASGEIFYNRNTSSLRVYNGNDRGGYELVKFELDGTLDINTQKNKIRFHWDTLADLNLEVDPVDYHGMIAHVHDQARLYFAHAGEWVPVANYSELSQLDSYALNDLSNVSNEDFLSKAESSGFSGGASVDVGINPPAEPEQGNIWFNSNNGKLFVYINDGDSTQWVQPSTALPPAFTSVLVNSTDQIDAQTSNNLSLDQGSNIEITTDVQTNTITISALAGFSGDYNDLDNAPILATVATSGDYNDLSNTPTSFSGLTASALAPNNALEIVDEADSSVGASFAANGNLTVPEFFNLGDAYLSKTYEYAHTLNAVSSSVTFNGDTTQNGSVFYLTSPAGNFVANFANVNTTGDNKTVSYALIIDQGATAYMPSNIQVNGSTQQVKWQGGTGSPAGNPNQLDIISITVLIDNEAIAEVFASLTTYA